MKIMYISARFENNICATTHLNALKELSEEEDLYIVDLRPGIDYTCEAGKTAYGSFSRKEWIMRNLELNTWYLSNKRIHDICRIIEEKKISHIFMDESIFGKLTKKIKKNYPYIKIITFYHDIARDLYPQWLKDKGKNFLIEFIAGIYGEKLNQRYSDVNLVLNERDKNLFIKAYNKNPEGFLPMAVEVPDFKATNADEFLFKKETGKEIYLLFVASLYTPNLFGLKWFVENVFVNMPECYNLLVVGRGMDVVRKEYLAYKRVHIIGEVKSLAAFYNNADVVIAPLFSGGGMKQKTAEAFAYGKCFVGTTESLQGYESAISLTEKNHQIVFSCDSAKEQLKAFEYIEANKLYGYHKDLNELFQKQYSKEAIKHELVKWLEL